MSTGWFAYSGVEPGAASISGMALHGGDGDAALGGPEPSRPPELADVRRLFRRGVRRVVAAARVDETVTLGSLVHGFLGESTGGLAVAEETWPLYE